MVQQLKTLSTKPDGLGLILGTHIMERAVGHKLFSDLHMNA